MWPRYFSISILLLIVGAVGQMLAPIIPIAGFGGIATKILTVANLMAIFYLWRFGQLSQTPFRFIMYGIAATGIAGVVIKLLLWPLADMLLAASIWGLALAYLVWFLAKPEKQRNDFLKLIWICLFCCVLYVTIMQIMPGSKWEMMLGFLNFALLHYTYIQFYYMRKRNPEALQQIP